MVCGCCQAGTVPVPDKRATKAMEFIGIGTRELAVFWRRFRRGDKKLRGIVTVDAFFKLFGEKRSIFGEGIFELLDINIAKTDDIDFGKFMDAVVTYCLFEPEEILRFCFYVFDRDKNGYIDKEDMLLILRVLHRVEATDNFDGNIRNALQKMDFDHDGKVDWGEFRKFHSHFQCRNQV